MENLYDTNFLDVKVKLNNGILRVDLVEYPVINQLIIIGEPKTKFTKEIERLIF